MGKSFLNMKPKRYKGNDKRFYYKKKILKTFHAVGSIKVRKQMPDMGRNISSIEKVSTI